MMVSGVDVCGRYGLAAMETTLFTTCTVGIPCYRNVTMETKNVQQSITNKLNHLITSKKFQIFLMIW